MSSLLYLNANDFSFDPTSQQPVMKIRSQNMTLVLFYSNECHYCHTLVPLFKTLPNKIHGCTFAMVNITNIKDVIRQSQKTTTPIEYVPLVMLYVNGLPYMKYEGEHSERGIREFFENIIKQNNRKQSFMTPPLQQQHKPGTFGVPLCGKNDKCYVKLGDLQN